jgi:hypothetical protein
MKKLTMYVMVWMLACFSLGAKADLLSGIDLAGVPGAQSVEELPVAQTQEEIDALLVELDRLMAEFNSMSSAGEIYVDEGKSAPVYSHPKVPYSDKRISI